MTGKHPHEIESLISLSSKLKGAIVDAADSYQSLPPILDQELKAIKTGRIADAETTLYTKETMTAKIETAFESMANISEEVAKLTGNKPGNLSELVSIFNIKNHDNSLAHQVLEHQSKNLISATENLIEIARKVKPLLEVNRLLVTKMQENYNQSYKFWQEIKEEVEGSYTADGTKKITGRHHGFSVRV